MCRGEKKAQSEAELRDSQKKAIIQAE